MVVFHFKRGYSPLFFSRKYGGVFLGSQYSEKVHLTTNAKSF